MSSSSRIRASGAVWIAGAVFLLSTGCSDSTRYAPASDIVTAGAPAAGGSGGSVASANSGAGGVSRPPLGGSVTAGTGAGGTNSIPSAGATSSVRAGGANSTGTGGANSSGAGGTNASGGATAVAGGASSAGAGGGSAGAAGGATGPSFPSVSNLGSNGPYAATTTNNTGPNGKYTIYRPTELAPGGAKNPIVGWMSGGSTTPSAYPMLPHLATHGFVVVASNTAPAIGQEVALGKEIIAGIDWIVAENTKTGSPFFEKLDTTKIASMGYSMGGLATTTIAADPRLTTTVHISGGNMETDRIKQLHAPAAFICGASGVDIAGANCATDFDAAAVPVFYGVFVGGDHLGVLTQPYAGRIRMVVTGWLRWQLMSDASLKSMFAGDQCSLCKDTNWTVKQKGLM